jgi:hypothetical protein
MNLNDLVNRLPTRSKYVVDIGASSGVNTNPVFSFENKIGFRGLCIEGDANKARTLRTNILPTFKIFNTYITPRNAIELFQKAGVPAVFDILKIDIDGYDLEVIRAILKVYRPMIIIAEINEKIPPPVEFEVLYSDTYAWDVSHFFGFSISAGDKVMRENGYTIVSLYDMNNILCIHNSVLSGSYPTVEQIFKTQYANVPHRAASFPWNQNVDHWLSITDKDALVEEITHYFENVNDRSNLSIKTKNKGVDFIIS